METPEQETVKDWLGGPEPKDIKSLTSELSSALESYNRECKRNDELQKEVDTLKRLITINDEHFIEVKNITKSQVEEILLYREALTLALPYVKGAYECAFPDQNENDYVVERIESALSKFQPKKDESTIQS